MTATLKVSLHPHLAPHAPEVKYVFRTLLRLAGYGYEFVWSEDAAASNPDIYYGPSDGTGKARWRIAWCGKSFTDAAAMEPASLHTQDGQSFLDFGQPQRGFQRSGDGSLNFASDIVFGCYWLLTGAAEPHYKRDRVDNLSLDGSFFLRHAMLEKPLVSLYAQFLREDFTQLGRTALGRPWSGKAAAFAFTHDVDYPQIIRWIECLRLLQQRGFNALASIKGVMDGSNHFWKFAEWVDFEKERGARPTFYFAVGRGSLLRYATGTPDVFYDIHAPEFRELFRYLRANGCEIGLHASYHAHRQERIFFREKQSLEEAIGGPVDGNRNHYWHLNPLAPNDTLRMHEQSGFQYDTSLAFEFYPGFRRGICHPFRPFHPGERRELEILQVPPTWMDDHFDRRLVKNGITDPEGCARGLLDTVRATGGAAVVDYHVRGMNGDFFPRYGPWIREFARKRLDSSLAYLTPREIARHYVRQEKALEKASADRTNPQPIEIRSGFEVGPMRAEEAAAVSRLHYDLFGDPAVNGSSIATLGTRFLERAFYLPNLQNPAFCCDVARYGGQVVGWIAYTTRRDAFRNLFGKRFVGIALEAARAVLTLPAALFTMLGNVRYLGGDKSVAEHVSGLWLVVGVHPRCRTTQFEARAGVSVASALFESMERTMMEKGCNGWCAGMRTGNPAIRMFVEMRGARHVGTVRAQGVVMDQFVKMFATAETTEERAHS